MALTASWRFANDDVYGNYLVINLMKNTIHEQIILMDKSLEL